MTTKSAVSNGRTLNYDKHTKLEFHWITLAEEILLLVRGNYRGAAQVSPALHQSIVKGWELGSGSGLRSTSDPTLYNTAAGRRLRK